MASHVIQVDVLILGLRVDIGLIWKTGPSLYSVDGSQCIVLFTITEPSRRGQLNRSITINGRPAGSTPAQDRNW